MLKDLAFADVAQELAGTRRILERVPDEHLEWQPHGKSMALGALATHLVNLVLWSVSILRQDAYDFGASPPPRNALPSREAMLAEFDERRKKFEAALADATDERLAATWTLRNGDHVIFAAPRAVALRSFGFSHMAHHRAQLSVYLRLLDVPVPGLYGPSADEAR